MADFKKLSEVPEVETAAEGAKVILEQNGEIVRGPAPQSSGGSVVISLIPKQDSNDYYNSDNYVAYLGQAVVEETMLENPRDINGNSLPIITGQEILELCQNGSTIYTQPLDMIAQFSSISQCIGKVFHYYDLVVTSFDSSMQPGGQKGAYLACNNIDYKVIDE